MAASPKKSLALDTNLLLDLAGEKDFAHAFAEEFRGRGYCLHLPPTVIAELAFFTSLNRAPQREFADTALAKLRDWKIQADTLTSTQLAIATRFARRLISASLIPEAEVNDGKILAQTSLLGISLLVTSDEHLLGIEEGPLFLAFNEADLHPVHPAHPKALLKALR